MFYPVHSAGSAPRPPVRRLVALGATLLGLSLLSGCSQGPPKPANVVEEPPQPTELQFDERYLDSVDTKPWSARTKREMAIDRQLRRLEMARRSKYDPTAPNDSVWDQPIGGGPMVGWPSRAAQLADIYRRIDSLKVLEGIRPTPH